MENIQPGKERGAIESAFIHVSNFSELSTEPSNAESFFDDDQSQQQQIVQSFIVFFSDEKNFDMWRLKTSKTSHC